MFLRSLIFPSTAKKVTTTMKTSKPAATTKAYGNTCQGKSCDYWTSEEQYTCAVMEKDYGCSCSGCKCALDKMIKSCKDFKYKGDY